MLVVGTVVLIRRILVDGCDLTVLRSSSKDIHFRFSNSWSKWTVEYCRHLFRLAIEILSFDGRSFLMVVVNLLVGFPFSVESPVMCKTFRPCP